VSPPVQAARNYTHHRHLLLLLSPKADTHLPTHRNQPARSTQPSMVYPSTDGHPSRY